MSASSIFPLSERPQFTLCTNQDEEVDVLNLDLDTHHPFSIGLVGVERYSSQTSCAEDSGVSSSAVMIVKPGMRCVASGDLYSIVHQHVVHSYHSQSQIRTWSTPHTTGPSDTPSHQTFHPTSPSPLFLNPSKTTHMTRLWKAPAETIRILGRAGRAEKRGVDIATCAVGRMRVREAPVDRRRMASRAAASAWPSSWITWETNTEIMMKGRSDNGTVTPGIYNRVTMVSVFNARRRR